MKPVGDRGRVWHCLVLKLICKTMASPNDSSLTQLLPGMLTCVGLPHLKTLTIRPQLRQWMPESSMTEMMQLHLLQLRRVSTLHQVLLDHWTSTTTLLLHHLLLMGMSRKLYVFKTFWSSLTKGGEAYGLIVFKRVHMGGCYTFAKCLQLSLLKHLVLWVVTLKLDGRLLLFLLFCDAMINSACAMINPARSHIADVHFSLCMSLYSSYLFMHDELSS